MDKLIAKNEAGEVKSITFTLSESDIESAIRHFICTCHPETATGFLINPDNCGQVLKSVPTVYLASKG